MNARLISSLRSLLGCLVIVSTAACSAHSPSGQSSFKSSGRTITAEQIRKSGAKNAWEALRRGNTHLLIRQNTRDDQVRVSHRGRSSLLLSPEVLVVVDGVQMRDAHYLREIPAETVRYIQILSGREGTVWYGTPAGNGVIVVKTGVPVS